MSGTRGTSIMMSGFGVRSAALIQDTTAPRDLSACVCGRWA